VDGVRFVRSVVVGGVRDAVGGGRGRALLDDDILAHAHRRRQLRRHLYGVVLRRPDFPVRLLLRQHSGRNSSTNEDISN